MKNHFYLSITFAFLIAGYALSQDTYKRNEAADVQSYIFKLALNDDNNSIKGEAIVTVKFNDAVDKFELDLIEKSELTGMQVTGVYEKDALVKYEYENNKISIAPFHAKTNIHSYTIKYHGIPERGLVIDTTKFGQRSFFGDNWPNLARHWLPCVDHPYDKASIEFRIAAPEYYDVIATGKKTEESSLGDGVKLTIYKEPAPVAMKVVTIGVTRFANTVLGNVGDIEVSAWVYPENRLDGFSDYAVAVDVLEYFIEKIGPYAYAKLANMQAKTQWGGLENAGTITYFENSVTGKNTVEDLIAHEIAHQWFGNSATENSWNHVWLSEGFATYFAILFQEHAHGDDKRKEELAIDRRQIIAYYKKNPAPIVDNSIKDPMRVLSVNSYQKGGWFLNMLRHKLGDDVFWTGIRLYYDTHKNSNAMTVDFRIAMEKASGKDLSAFFEQWLFTKGHPELKWNYAYKKGKLKINIQQLQKHHLFDFPIEIGIKYGDELKIVTLQMSEASEVFNLKLDTQPSEVILDPQMWLLFEEKK